MSISRTLRILSERRRLSSHPTTMMTTTTHLLTMETKEKSTSGSSAASSPNRGIISKLTESVSKRTLRKSMDSSMKSPTQTTHRAISHRPCNQMEAQTIRREVAITHRGISQKFIKGVIQKMASSQITKMLNTTHTRSETRKFSNKTRWLPPAATASSKP